MDTHAVNTTPERVTHGFVPTVEAMQLVATRWLDGEPFTMSGWCDIEADEITVVFTRECDALHLTMPLCTWLTTVRVN